METGLHTSRITIEKIAGGERVEIYKGHAKVPWREIEMWGPCHIVVSNHGPEMVVVNQPASMGNGHRAQYIAPNDAFVEKFSIDLECQLSEGCIHVNEHMLELPLERSYQIPFHTDNLFRSLAGEDNSRRRREIQIACSAQANIPGFPQGAVQANVLDPPDILIVPIIHGKPNHSIGLEISELIDQSQHEAFLHAKATVCEAMKQWVGQRKLSAGLRIGYRITKDLIARLRSGSGPEDKCKIIDEAIHIIDCSVHEYLRRGAVGTIDSKSIPFVWNGVRRRCAAPEVINVTVSGSNSRVCDSHYYFPVSGISWSNDRFLNTLGEDVTLNTTRLQDLISRKIQKIERRFPGGHPFSSLFLYLIGGCFPTGSSKSGSFGILHVSNEHPGRHCQYDIAPFSGVYIGQESSNYIIDGESNQFSWIEEPCQIKEDSSAE